MLKLFGLVICLISFTSATLIDPKNLPLSTKGATIVDKKGNEVRLACVNWYGAHMERYAANGLDLTDINEISEGIADKGFNCVRLVFSLEQFYKNPVVEDSVLAANPSLKGKKSMEVFDATVKALVNAGVMVILNNHISDAMWCCGETDGNGLWHNKNYSAKQWEDALVKLTTQYKDEPMVIGNDLRNEIRDDSVEGLTPDWGSGNVATDWKMAATKAGNAVLKVDPTQLIIIEGLNYANDMMMIKTDPITLDTANKLVYSFHYYSWQPDVARMDSYENLRDDLDKNIGFIIQEGQKYTAPLWLGEFGTADNSNYWKYLIQYLGERPQISWAYWAYNGYQHTPEDNESFGILNNDMKTVRHPWKLTDVQSVKEPKKSSKM